MTPENFCYWLQGRAELMPEPAPSAEEWKQIKEHLAMAFEHKRVIRDDSVGSDRRLC